MIDVYARDVGLWIATSGRESGNVENEEGVPSRDQSRCPVKAVILYPLLRLSEGVNKSFPPDGLYR